jgi:hypothetical protein
VLTPCSVAPELSELSEGQARGGGSRPELGIDASSFTGAKASLDLSTGCGRAVESCLGSRAATEADVWHAGVQQSILEWSAGLPGIFPSIVQPGITFEGTVDALAATGASASPNAQRIEINSRITCARIGANR